MNIFLYELKAYRKSTLIWTISLVAIVILFMALFPSISNDIEDFTKLLEGYPEPVRKALGLELNTFGSILGFYSYSFVYITLIGAIQGMILGTSIISKELREKTADFLFTKPVSRTRILTSKLLAALASLIFTNVCYVVAASIIASQVKVESYDIKIFMMISVTLLFVQIIFLALGTIMSVIIRKMKSVLTVSLGTVFSFFIIGMIAASGEGEGKRYLSPFKYFDSAYIIENGRYETSFIFVGLGVVIISILTSFIIYTKKDIHTV